MKIREIRAVGLRGATPEGGWSEEIQPDPRNLSPILYPAGPGAQYGFNRSDRITTQPVRNRMRGNLVFKLLDLPRISGAPATTSFRAAFFTQTRNGCDQFNFKDTQRKPKQLALRAGPISSEDELRPQSPE